VADITFPAYSKGLYSSSGDSGSDAILLTVDPSGHVRSAYRNGSNWGNGRIIIDNGNYTSYVSKIGTSTLGSTTRPVYLNGGTPTLCNVYSGGTAVTLNGTSKASSTADFYAPTGSGTAGYFLRSGGSNASPVWATAVSMNTSVSSSILLNSSSNNLENTSATYAIVAGYYTQARAHQMVLGHYNTYA
jgi:hypothetical protein